ncbi:amino acid adenylation domain-containing protein [Pseudomonas vancouverensis]|uniref:Non-ribosomal peptide synthetase n=1 Tax=Pseudomonas vancouverensis TaxID=95300 RepID=A0A1H2MIZ3_PSEVA|nr:non-ribosomal peptide synthetase [Pseudomonas vancouverensis]KAB0494812.1 amino acid adenylation domain-containing protein [Pseudomonas vancouverensis]TDB63546.1 non-ribosomal peptide synthetase [Pseudomonas vancouverensis]SDU93159.1 non-ribosomal peptide synthase domain TIGR01720/amino acid adenylation domain-containing protein [Pseudomonas vancouverensis]
MSAAPDRMMTLAQRFCGLSPDARRDLQTRMQAQGLTLELLPIPPRDRRVDTLPASYAQQRLWFLWQMQPEATAYNLTGAFRLNGELNRDALARTLNALVQRHEVLRTTFEFDGLQVLQKIHPSMPALLVEADAADDADLQRQIALNAEPPFDLQHGPLMRCRLIRLGARQQVLAMTLHHIVTDGGSLPILLQEFTQLYAQFSAGQDETLPEQTIQYADFARWQRLWLEAGEAERQLNYWREQLGHEHPPLNLPADRRRPASPNQQGASVELQVPAALTAQLRELARREGCTLFMVLMAALQTLLHRYSGEQDIRVGVPIANRTRQDVENLLGFFVNTQVLRSQPHADQPFVQLLAQIKQAALGAQAHQDLPFEQLVDGLGVERSLSHTPLFQVMFNHQRDSGELQRWELPRLSVEPLVWDEKTTKFDLMLDTVDSDDGIHASFVYATELFDAATIERLGRHWLNLLQAIGVDASVALADLAMLDAAEQQATLLDWNRSAKANASVSQLCAHQLIEAQAAAHPHKIAVTCEGVSLTYAELNGRANRIAHRLRERGVGPDVLVGIALERSLEMIVSLLAILKAGGAYVPLDPQYPQDRLAYMLADSGTGLLLTDSTLLPRLPVSERIEVICLDHASDWLDEASADNLANLSHPQNLAYVIYTSGSTGKPKGTLLPHSNLTRLFSATEHWFGFNADDIWSLFHSYAFDFSVWEIFGALFHGGKLVVVPHAVSRSPEDFARLLGDEGVTVLNQTPSAFRQLLPFACANAQRLNLRYVVFGGEALDVASLRPWYEVFDERQPLLINMYGITETTVHVTYRALSRADLDGANSSPLGQPISDLRWYVLDPRLNPVAKGCVGELYVGGAGLARGYHQRADLSATRFVPDLFAVEPGARLYRTGDLARYCADGSIEYAGRIDHQVKIRGFRIELGEIQDRLQSHSAIEQALVLAPEVNGSQQLVAWFSARQDSVDLRQSLREHLQAGLPDYMVPAHLIALDHWPLTSNGKLDRNALPQPDAALAQQAYTAPMDGMQTELTAIWQEVLKLARVGIDDNFFELGGDSIIAIQVVSRARQAGIRISPRDLFQHQTVQSLAKVAERSAGLLIDQGPVRGEVLLTPIQHGFFDQAIETRHHWNQSLLLELREPLDNACLQQALAALLDHHDALRLRFHQVDGRWQQAQAEQWTSADLLWQRQAAGVDELLDQCNAAQASLNLQEGPLLRALLVDMGAAGQRLLLVVHHLAVDGVSWRVLLEDLHSTYQQAQQGQAPRLLAKTSAYQAWAARLQAHARSPELAAQGAYWLAQYDDVRVELPADNPHGSLGNQHAVSVETVLDSQFTRQLLQDAPAAYRTQVNDLLLTALARVLRGWTGQPSTLVKLEGHGREDLFDDIDLSRTVGWFTSIFPVKLTPAEDLAASIKAVKEQLRAVPEKGIGFGILRYLSDSGLSDLPSPQVTFNYMGQFDASFDEQAPWRPAQENGGTEQGDSALLDPGLSINGQVYAGQLRLSWSFSGERFNPHAVQGLADAYGAELQRLIEHCLSGASGLTPSDVPLVAVDQAQLDTLPLAASQIADILPLSPMQQGMLFHSLFAPDAGAYVPQMRVDVQGLDVERFRDAWQQALDNHEVLRAGFFNDSNGSRPLQVILADATLPLTPLDWRDRADLASALNQRADDDRLRGFDLKAAPLLRLTLVQTASDSHHLIFTHHHILLDGWSTSQLFGEVLQRYAGNTPAPGVGRYRDYMAWLGSRDRAACEAFWLEQLQSFNEPTRLAGALPGPDAGQGGGHRTLHLSLDRAATERLSGFARQARVTPNTVLQAAWLLLLQRYTGQQTVTFGATVSGRPSELQGIEQQVGLFINTLPVIATPHPQCTVSQWIEEVQALNLKLRDVEYTPLADVQRWAGHAGEALFDTLLVFENYPVSQALEQGNSRTLKFSGISNHDQTSFPLAIAAELGECLDLRFNYDSALFDATAIDDLSTRLVALLDAMVCAPQQALGRLSLLNAAQTAHQVEGFNRTAQAWPDMRPVNQCFEAQALKTPDAPALVFAGQSLSYRELNQQANRLAHYLRSQGVGAEVLVGIAAERSLELVIGLLAIMKAGGAYVPLAPDYPRERLEHMFDDSGVHLLLTQRHLLAQLPIPSATTAICLDDMGDRLAGMSEENLASVVELQSLAYMIYTSGSTGKPKGAANRHDALYNRLAWMQDAYPLDGRDTVLQKTPFSFDVSVWEFFWPLMVGARLAVAEPGAHRDPALLVRLIEQYQVSTLHFVPSMLQAFVQGEGFERCASLRQILCSGEALSADLQRSLMQVLPNVGLYNLYGPTEAAIDVTHWTCVDDGAVSVPIGTPITNLMTYILDDSLQPQVRGCVGELYLGGIGLARGYHNRPDLTAERFVASPFATQGERLYRTGDLARYREDGVIEYVGRIDHQVKIRGLRIELGEIEACLLELPEVREAVVIALDVGKSKQLVAYVVADVAIDSLKQHLRNALPEHMQPSHVLLLQQMPVTPNGKLDRRALPLPDQQAREYLAPRNAVEATLQAVWQALFEGAPVGVLDNFFELGGDSIVSIQAVSRARKAGLSISPKQVFSHPSIAELALVAEAVMADESAAPVISATPKIVLSPAQYTALGLTLDEVEDVYPLSPMQQGMLFHSVQDGDCGLYVNQIEVGVRGVDGSRFRAAWADAAQRHAILRTAFLWEGDKEPLQVVLRDAPSLLTELDWRGLDNQSERVRQLAAQERERGFSLNRAPLLRLLLVRLEDDRYRLVWTYHHILMDGWSVSRLIGEVLRHYSGVEHEPVAAYRDYIDWLGQQMVEASERFWKDKLRDLEGATHLARALPVKEAQSGYHAIYSHLDTAQTERLQAFAQRQQVTLNTLVQAAWLLLLQRYTGQRTVTFGATVSGRPESLNGSENMLGLFINTLPVVSTVPTDVSVGDWLREIQGYNLAIRDFQQTPLSDIQRWAGQGGQALFDSIIVFENQPVDRTLREWNGDSLRFEDVSDFGLTSFAMDLMVSLDEGLRIEYMHQREQFDLASVEALRGHMESLMQRLCDDAGRAVGELGLLTLDEGRQLDGALPVVAGGDEMPVHELIRQRARLQPLHTALVLSDAEGDAEQLSYAELDRRSDALAAHLLAQGLQTEDVIGVFMERSLELVVSLLAVMKCGATYVPLDPQYPQERLRYMMADSDMRLLLTQQRLRESAQLKPGTAVVAVDRLDLDVDVSVSPQNVHGEQLAYLIYTSGSTGKPKSVAVAHGPLSMHVQAIAELYDMDPENRELHFMSFAFDGAHERWITALISGSTLVIRDNSLWTAEQTLAVLHRQRISVACFPPAYLLQLAEHAELQGGDPPPVRIYCFGGDAVPEATFERVKHSLKPQFLVNGYGPTETVVTPLLWKIAASGHCEAMYAPIGQRVGARSLHVLDMDLNPLPVGMVGELYIGGRGVARGYHRHPWQSAERFVADPFSDEGGRLYRSGDLVRRRADGVFDYLGRVDHQVKVRGFRIELGEIEARLREQAGVNDALVVLRDNGQGPQLVGYVVAAADDGLGLRCQAALRESLPDYMVPSRVVVLPRFPLTPNGKLDRKALPDPGFSGRDYVAPRTPLEWALAQIWQQVLGVDQVGITDNFFELGGDSLRTLKVISKVRALNLPDFQIKLRDMMAKPTIAGLSGVDEQAERQSPQPLLLLNQRVDGQPALFCLHAGFGTVFDYEPLARRLDGQRTVYGVQCRMLLDRQWQDSSLAHMAGDYVEAIRARQPQGPYHLLGWSLGGALALMVSDLLEQQGQGVAFIGLVDSFVPTPANAVAEVDEWRADLAEFLGATLGMDDDVVTRALSVEAMGDHEGVTRVVRAVIATQSDQASGYALLGADELAQTFMVSTRLKALSRQVDSLPIPQGALSCWWAEGNPTAERATLERQQPRLREVQRVSAGHFDILHKAECLDAVVAALTEEEVPQM